MPKRQYKTNAERQAAYRARQRNVTGAKPAIGRNGTKDVTDGICHPRCTRCMVIMVDGTPWVGHVVSSPLCPPEWQCLFCEGVRARSEPSNPKE